jgi:Protein of unknown function (DUF2970)
LLIYIYGRVVSPDYYCFKSDQALLFLSVTQEIIVSKPTIIQTITTILAAFVGVQSDKNRKLDFEQGSLTTYVIGGLIFTVLFVATLIFVVSKVLGN